MEIPTPRIPQDDLGPGFGASAGGGPEPGERPDRAATDPADRSPQPGSGAPPHRALIGIAHLVRHAVLLVVPVLMIGCAKGKSAEKMERAGESAAASSAAEPRQEPAEPTAKSDPDAAAEPSSPDALARLRRL